MIIMSLTFIVVLATPVYFFFEKDDGTRGRI